MSLKSTDKDKNYCNFCMGLDKILSDVEQNPFAAPCPMCGGTYWMSHRAGVYVCGGCGHEVIFANVSPYSEQNPRQIKKTDMVNDIIEMRTRDGESIPESEINHLFSLPFVEVMMLYKKYVVECHQCGEKCPKGTTIVCPRCHATVWGDTITEINPDRYDREYTSKEIDFIRAAFPDFEVVDNDSNYIALRKLGVGYVEGRVNRGSLGAYSYKFVVEKLGERNKLFSGKNAIERIKKYLGDTEINPNWSNDECPECGNRKPKGKEYCSECKELIEQMKKGKLKTVPNIVPNITIGTRVRFKNKNGSYSYGYVDSRFNSDTWVIMVRNFTVLKHESEIESIEQNPVNVAKYIPKYNRDVTIALISNWTGISKKKLEKLTDAQLKKKIEKIIEKDDWQENPNPNCSVCGERYRQLKRVESFGLCPSCRASYRRTGIREANPDEPRVCKRCNQSFLTEKEYNMHFQQGRCKTIGELFGEYYPETNPTLHCENCGKENPQTYSDSSYTTCCNELVCYGDESHKFGTPEKNVVACCWAKAREKGIHEGYMINPLSEEYDESVLTEEEKAAEVRQLIEERKARERLQKASKTKRAHPKRGIIPEDENLSEIEYLERQQRRQEGEP
jgi:hypothetical protein